MPLTIDPYLKLLGLIALLFFLPKVLVRFGLPSPVTELLLGVACGPLVLRVVERSDLLVGLAGIGISALFLFAGIEVDVHELYERRQVLLQHLAIQLLLFAVAAVAGVWFGLPVPVAALIGVAVLSPSAGFIVPALDALGLPGPLTSWIKQKAIGTELMAIAAVLVFVNTGSARDLVVGLGGMLALLALLPVLFFVFHRTILRWAPRTEFSFVMILALLAAYLTHHLGVHYLVGAFVVGLAARRYLDWCASQQLPVAPVRTAINSFRFFSAFFVPFYFFGVGLLLPIDALSAAAILFAAILLALAVPVRVASVAAHRRFGLGESWREAVNVGLLLGPTTVFSLAVAEILRHRFAVDDWVYGGIILYGAATSMVPVLSRRAPRSTEFEDVVPLTSQAS
jgi:Kef-type K+ transport system membrane component KefB